MTTKKIKKKVVAWMKVVGNVFWLPIRQIKFFGTIEFLVSILDLNIQICRPFVPCKISHMYLWIPTYLWMPRVRNHPFVSVIYHFLFSLLITIVLALEPNTPCCKLKQQRYACKTLTHCICWEDKIKLWNLTFCICFTKA